MGTKHSWHGSLCVGILVNDTHWVLINIWVKGTEYVTQMHAAAVQFIVC